MITYRRSEVELPGPGHIKIHRGGATYVLNRGLYTPEGLAGLQTLSAALFNHPDVDWFQLWRGEVVPLGLPVEEPSLRTMTMQ